MSAIVFSLLQLAIPVLVSLVAAVYLRAVIQGLLLDLCGTGDRAQFWSRCLIVAMLAVPLMLVLLLTDAPVCAAAEYAACTARVLRHTLAWTAGGILLAMGLMIYAVARYLPPEIERNASS
jgi:hypothetical protein